MFLSAVASKIKNPAELNQLMKALKEGLGIAENHINWAVSTVGAKTSGEVQILKIMGTQAGSTAANGGAGGSKGAGHGQAGHGTGRELGREVLVEGDVLVVKAKCLDMALWKIGGAAVALRLVQLANVRLFFLKT